MGRPVTVTADVYREGWRGTDLDGIRIKVLATPGHTAGGVQLLFPGGRVLKSGGDTLFQESVGRTDFPTGSMSTLVRSVKEKLFTLPEETVVYPGHGDSTTSDMRRNIIRFALIKSKSIRAQKELSLCLYLCK